MRIRRWGKEGGEMSTGKSEKQTWGRAVYLGWGVCVCADGAEEIFSGFSPIFGKKGKVEPPLSGKSAAIFPSFCNPQLCPYISGNQMLFLTTPLCEGLHPLYTSQLLH